MPFSPASTHKVVKLLMTMPKCVKEGWENLCDLEFAAFSLDEGSYLQKIRCNLGFKVHETFWICWYYWLMNKMPFILKEESINLPWRRRSYSHWIDGEIDLELDKISRCWGFSVSFVDFMAHMPYIWTLSAHRTNQRVTRSCHLWGGSIVS